MIKEGTYIITSNVVENTDSIILNGAYKINDLEIRISNELATLSSITLRFYLSNPNFNSAFIPYIDYDYPNLNSIDKTNGYYILPLDSDFEKAYKKGFALKTNKILLLHNKDQNTQYKCHVIINRTTA